MTSNDTQTQATRNALIAAQNDRFRQWGRTTVYQGSIYTHREFLSCDSTAH